MYSEIQKYIIEEIEEVGEVAFYLLIPTYLKKIKKFKLKIPVDEYTENYDISHDDFLTLRQEIIDLMKRKKIGLFKSNSKKHTELDNWEDYFDLIDENTTTALLVDERFWKDKPTEYYVLSDIE